MHEGTGTKLQLRKSLSRRQLLRGAVTASVGMTTLPSLLGACSDGAGSSRGEIRIGVIDDLSGDFTLPNRPRVHAYHLAVDEINGKRGINDRKLKLIVYDGQSDVNRYQQLAQRLILDDEVDVLMAGYTSSEREAARAVAVKYKTIFWHNNQGEGGIADKYSFFTGPVPEQQILPGLKFMIEKFGPKFYILAADYGFGQISTQWAHVAAGLYGGSVIGQEFIPLGNSQFASTISKIQAADPDFMLHYLVGAEQSQFYPQAASAGLHLPMISTVIIQQGYEHKRFASPALADMYIPTDYQEELNIPENRRFVKAFRAKYPDEPYINENARSAYVAVNFMAEAWRRAGTTRTGKVIQALESGISIQSPSGLLELDPAVHHTKMPIYNAYIDNQHKLSFPNDFGNIAPWWLRKHMNVDLRESDPATQYLPKDDRAYGKYLG